MNSLFVTLMLSQWGVGLVLAVVWGLRRGLIVKFLTTRPVPRKRLTVHARHHFIAGFAWMAGTMSISAVGVPVLPIATTFMWMANLLLAFDAQAYEKIPI